jgi:hypothetical protein
MVALEVKDRAMYQVVTTALTVEQQTLLIEIMRIAEESATAVLPTGGAGGGPSVPGNKNNN